MCRVAVPFFVVTLCIFTFRHLVKGGSPQPWKRYAWRKTRRLYLPFLFWSLIYLVLRLLKHEFFPGGSPIRLNSSTLVTGTAHHLWFLPMALLVSFVLHPVSKLTMGGFNPQIWLWLFLALGVGSGLMQYPGPVDATDNGWSYFAAMTWGCLPAVFIAVPLAGWLPSAPSPAVIRWGWIGVIVTGAWLAFLPYAPLVPCLGGISLFIAAHLALSSQTASVIAFLGTTSFGVYLIHVAIVEGIQAALLNPNGVPTVPQDLAIAAAATVASVLCVVIARRLKSLRLFFP